MSNETVLNNRYRLVAQQGSGGMAVIYRAIDQALGRTVAIKILRPSLTSDPAFLARFKNEARSVANLAHPNIVTVHDVGNDDQTHYIVMEFVEGQDLKKIIKTVGPMPPDRVLNLAIQICGGIGFAHRAGLVHADVKPQNILVTKDDIVKVTDFGIAQALSDANPGEKQAVVWGSPHYFAPEQARGERPTPASDVYSIGIVMFEMLTGRLPYTGANQQELALAHIRDRVPLVTEINPNVPPSLANIVYKTMSKEPAQRYRMADQLGHILMSLRERGSAQTLGNIPVVRPSQTPPSAPTVQNQPVVPLPPTQPQYPPQQGYAGQGMPPRMPDLPNTQRVDLAPVAPGTTMPGQRPMGYPQQQGYPPSTQAGPYYNPTQPPPGSSQPYYSQPYQPKRRSQATGSLDTVTIALAFLAFMAVACLIPLYIAVDQRAVVRNSCAHDYGERGDRLLPLSWRTDG
ncbi:MAG: protein kinase [Anaerolineae bacterium]